MGERARLTDRLVRTPDRLQNLLDRLLTKTVRPFTPTDRCFKQTVVSFTPADRSLSTPSKRSIQPSNPLTQGVRWLRAADRSPSRTDRSHATLCSRSMRTDRSRNPADGLLEQTVRLPVPPEKEEEQAEKSCEQVDRFSMLKDGLHEPKEMLLERKEKTSEQTEKEEEQPSRSLEPSAKTSKQTESSRRRQEKLLRSMNRFSDRSSVSSGHSPRRTMHASPGGPQVAFGLGQVLRCNRV
jgi:hypothetical protein